MSQDTAAAGPVDTVMVTIDGFEITVPKGTLIIRAAELLVLGVVLNIAASFIIKAIL